MRGQTHLPALVLALVVLTTATVLTFALADGAFASADRDAEQRRVAVALSERLVSPATPLTVRANVLNATALGRLTAGRLARRYPVVGDRAVRVRVDDRTVVERGTVTGGATIRRIVLVSERQARSFEPAFDGTNATSLPRRTPRVRLVVDPRPNVTVRTVRADGRVVLHNTSGLNGTYSTVVSRFETVRLGIEANRSLEEGSVRVTYYPERTTKAVLAVTADA